MYAVLETGSKQYRVTAGDTLEIERLETEAGKPFTFDRVLLVNNDGKVTSEISALAKITVEADLSPDQASFVIRDEGPGFDPGNVPDPTLQENLERECGRGLLLMRTFMDETRFNSRGNEVTMIKRHERRP